MMRRRTARLGLLLLALLGAGSASAANRTAAFAHADPGVRAGALGGAYTALGETPSGMYWNPSSLYFQDRNRLEASYSSLYSLGLASRTFVTAGFKRTLDVSSFRDDRVVVKKDDVTGAAYSVGLEALSLDLDDNGYSEISIGGAAAWGYDDTFIIGLAARILLVNSDLEGVGANGYDFGLGVTWKLSDRERIGIAAPHLFSRLFWEFDSTERLPLSATLGWARYWNDHLLSTVDVEWREDEPGPFRLAAGAEWWVFPDRVAARAGVRRLNGTSEDLVAPTFGAGVRFALLQLDYAFRLEDGDLGDTHRVGLLIDF
jgi:hypothetical protein